MEHEIIIVTCFDKQLLEWQENPAGKKNDIPCVDFFLSHFLSRTSVHCPFYY